MISSVIESGYPLSRSLFVVATVIAVVFGGWLAAHGRHGRWAAAGLSAAGIGVVLALTLSPVGSGGTLASRCNLEPYNYVSDTPNVVLFLLPAIFLVVATRSPALVLVLGPLGSASIEIAQYAMTGLGRRCDVDDLLANSAGTAIGVLLGAAVLGVAHLLRRRPVVEEDSRPVGTEVRMPEYRG